MEKRYNAAEIERRIYQKWEDEDAFVAQPEDENERFCIMIPPPNVTGVLHMGHAFNNTLQDILVRWHRMRGFDVLWQPGQDHAGIATQMVVERSLAEAGMPSRRELGREKFLEKVWDWKESSGGAIINQLKRLGASCDWSRNRFTMDPGFHNAVLKVFIDLYEKGYIFKGNRLVNWDPHFETAISDVEVEQVEVDGKMWHLRYELENGETYKHPVAFDSDGNLVEYETRNYLVVATTRPETMLGDTGVAVHPDDARYAHLVGKTARLPLANRSIPIVADSYADPAKGTGAVKITPAHDFNDWEVGVRQNLPAVNVMSPKAAMQLKGNDAFWDGCEPTEEAMSLDGLDRYAARERIVQLATRQGWLDKTVDDRHTVPHGDRSKVAIEPYLTDQWFVDAKKMVEPAIEAVASGKTKILPKRYAKTYFNWLENIEPWCISRQLWWGHQIPVWYDSDGRQYCAATEEEAVEKAGGKQLTRDPDVLDTWFSSGLWPIGTLGWPKQTLELREYFPTDVLVTGFDIIFFWVARMMMMQLAVVDEVPFRTVYVHALVRDQHGKKMAKSLGNVIDPLELIEKYGADAVRFTLASMAAMGRDLKLAESRVEGYRNFATKIWNAARYAEINGCAAPKSFNPSKFESTVNKWIIGETVKVRESVDEALHAYKFNEAANSLYSFVWEKFCNWYLEFTKAMFSMNDQKLNEEIKRTIGWVLDQCLILLHPFMPFITEEIWSIFPNRSTMLVRAPWPQLNVEYLEDCPQFTGNDPGYIEADRKMTKVIRLIEKIRFIREQMGYTTGELLYLRGCEFDASEKSLREDSEELFKRLARIGFTGDSRPASDDSVKIYVEGAEFELLLPKKDPEVEKKVLERKHGKLKQSIAVLEKQLKGKNFRKLAPPDLVERTIKNLRSRKEELKKNEEELKKNEEELKKNEEELKKNEEKLKKNEEKLKKIVNDLDSPVDTSRR